MDNQSSFDYDTFRQQALTQLGQGQELGGKDGVLAPLIKDLLEAALQGELSAHLQQSRPNRANGQKGKKVKTAHGPVLVEAPRDREGSFEPVILPKRHTTLGEGLDNKILSLYASGMSYASIRGHLEELYGLEVSEASLTAITDKILPVVEAWRTRPLEPVWCFVWLDAIHFKVRENHKVVAKAAYTVLGVNLQDTRSCWAFTWPKQSLPACGWAYLETCRAGGWKTSRLPALTT